MLITFSELGVAKKCLKKGKIKNGKDDHSTLKLSSQNTQVLCSNTEEKYSNKRFKYFFAMRIIILNMQLFSLMNQSGPRIIYWSKFFGSIIVTINYQSYCLIQPKTLISFYLNIYQLIFLMKTLQYTFHTYA